MCPADYRYSPRVFDRPADLTTDILYVVGGLYGNLPALDVVESLASEEKSNVTIVFNGDFHWFDAEREWFSEINAASARMWRSAAMSRPRLRAVTTSAPDADAPIPTMSMTASSTAPI